MATSIFVYPYKQASRSALALAKSLGGKVIKLENSKFRPSKDKLVINWGSSKVPKEIVEGCRLLNNPSNVSKVSNKYIFFSMVEAQGEAGPRIPDFTISNEVAKNWFNNKTKLVFARTVLNGHSGEGIVEVNSSEEVDKFPDGTLFVKYIPKRSEFRIHCTKEKAFCIQEKLRSLEKKEEKNFKVRNHANGYIFARQNINCPEDVITQAIKALNASNLDFGAVDVIWNELRQEAYVLEVNSAPGLEGSTIHDYVGLINE